MLRGLGLVRGRAPGGVASVLKPSRDRSRGGASGLQDRGPRSGPGREGRSWTSWGSGGSRKVQKHLSFTKPFLSGFLWARTRPWLA